MTKLILIDDYSDHKGRIERKRTSLDIGQVNTISVMNDIGDRTYTIRHDKDAVRNKYSVETLVISKLESENATDK